MAAAGVAWLAVLSGELRAQAVPAESGAEPDEVHEAIVVTGSLDRRDPVSAFVDGVTLETADQIAKYATPICPVSLGLPSGHAEVIEARMRQVAHYLGVGANAEGCRPNVVVVVAEEGGDFVQQLRRERPELFSALELSDLRRIMRLTGPVRAWHVVEPRGADGRPMQRIAFLTTGPNEPPRPIPRGYMLSGVMPSVTQRSTRQDLTFSFVVFELQAIEGLTLLQLADHAVMRALARTEPSSFPAGRSILGLFADQEAGAAPAAELTAWDAAYLGALYRTSHNVTAHQQRSNMAQTMRRELSATTRP